MAIGRERTGRNRDVCRGLVSRLPLALAAACVLQLLFVLHMFPLPDMMGTKPIVTKDYPIHLYNLVRFRDTILDGKLTMYDPSFGTGIAASALELLRGRDLLLLSIVLFWLPPALLFKGYLLMANLAIPILMFAAARGMGLDSKEAAASSLIAALSWQFLGIWERMMFSGVFSFLLGSLMALTSAAFYASYLQKRRMSALLLCAGSAGIALLMHIQHLLTLMVLFMALAAKQRRELLRLLPVGALIAVSLIALWPSLQLLMATQVPPPFHQSGGLRAMASDLLREPFQTLLVLAGLIGLARSSRRDQLFVAGASIVFLLLGYFGSVSVLSYAQPQRMLVPWLLLLMLFSGRGLMKLRLRAHLLLVVLVIAYSLLAGLPRMMLAQWSDQAAFSLPQDTRDLMAWLDANTTTTGRLLLENSGYRTAFVYGGHALALFPLSLDRELAGGYYPYNNARQGLSRPEYSEGLLFNRNEWSEEELRQVLDAYNIQWIVSWSEPGKRLLQDLPTLFEEVGRVGRFTIHQAKRTPSYFLEGSGDVRAELNSLHLTNLSKGRVVLRYVYDRHLSRTDRLPLDRFITPQGVLISLESEGQDVRITT